MHPLLEIKKLHIDFVQDAIPVPAVKDISFTITRGKLTAIVGESGSGKSVTALSVLHLLPKQANFKGEILFSSNGEEQVALNALPGKEINKIRGNEIAMIFQEPMTSLNPVFTCGYQVMESLLQHLKLNRKEARQKTIELFRQVELPDPAAMIDRYPHQVSGGQKQRVMIAMAMSCNPDLLIADEPTTALDVRVQKNILDLIKKLQQQNNMSVLLITHDLGLVAEVADEIIVMYKGEIVEQGNAAGILKAPRHPYTKALLACRPAANAKGKKLKVLNDFLEETENLVSINTGSKQNIIPADPVLSVMNLEVFFPAARNIFGKAKAVFKAVDDVSFDILAGEIVGLVGESGCGKTTLGRAILQLVKPTAGKIILAGRDITAMPLNELRNHRKDLQIIFQDPYGSLNPRISIGSAIQEALKVHQLYENNKLRKEMVIHMLEKVQLSPDHFKRYPHQFSGGQRQRICIARALALKPSFLIFDEAVSALDVSVQAGILNLISELKADMNFTSIFISHDLSVIHYISDRIMVMNKGKIIETGSAGDVYFHPKMDYTRQLIEAIPGRRLA
ncbi:MAG: ABC transporter ATP-binding protein [Ferruginibacter sp.]